MPLQKTDAPAAIGRQSPVRFTARPRKTEMRNHWPVCLEYEQEGSGPWLTDLSHLPRWDFQDGRIDDQTVCGLAIPGSPGQCTLSGNTLVSRLNPSQANVSHFGSSAPALPQLAGYTDVSEATLLLALFGPKAFLIAEKLTYLDLMDPVRQPPFLLQGPFCKVPCQIVILERNEAHLGGFLLSCSRGYGDSMVAAILGAGADFGLRPAGESRFQAWIERLRGQP